jgi:hypothetical protein
MNSRPPWPSLTVRWPKWKLLTKQSCPCQCAPTPNSLNELVNLVISAREPGFRPGRDDCLVLHAYISTDSYDKQAMRLYSEFQQRGVKLSDADHPDHRLGWFVGRCPAANLSLGGEASNHAYFLKLAADQSKYLMSEAEEGLAAELSLSGAQRLGQTARHSHLPTQRRFRAGRRNQKTAHARPDQPALTSR